MNAATLIAVTSETSTCECCGKTDLKRVAVIQLANGSIVRYGSDCAGKKLGKSFGKKISAVIEAQANYDKAVMLIEKWMPTCKSMAIANKINLSIPCVWEESKRVFWINGTVKYTPEMYRDSVSWWAA